MFNQSRSNDYSVHEYPSKKCIEQLVAEYQAKLKKLYTELAAIEEMEEKSVGCQGDETRASKRRRK